MNRDAVISEFLSEAGRQGGLATVARHGVQAMRRRGRKGGRARAAKYDAETLSAWARRGGRPRKTQKAGA